MGDGGSPLPWVVCTAGRTYAVGVALKYIYTFHFDYTLLFLLKNMCEENGRKQIVKNSQKLLPYLLVERLRMLVVAYSSVVELVQLFLTLKLLNETRFGFQLIREFLVLRVKPTGLVCK